MRDLVRSVAGVNKVARDAINSITGAKVTSVSKDGTTLNAENASGSEVREVTIMLPYGISSSAIDGIAVQIIMNTTNTGTVVGCKDTDRPTVKPGQLILYDKFGSKISLLNDGSIGISAKSGGEATIDKDGAIVIHDKSGSKIEMSSNGTITLTPSSGNMVVAGGIKISGDVALSGGGSAVARVGDEIQVTVGDHGLCKGKITAGSSHVTSG